MAFNPPSVIQGAPSGPTITPWGRDPAPSGVCRVSPDSGSSHPSSPRPCAVYQTPPSLAGATSWGRDPAGTENACNDLLEGAPLGGFDRVTGTSAVGTGPFVGSSGEADGGPAETRDVGDEVGTDVGVVTGSVGTTDPVHPTSARMVKVPRKSEVTRLEALLSPVDLSRLISLNLCASKPSLFRIPDSTPDLVRANINRVFAAGGGLFFDLDGLQGCGLLSLVTVLPNMGTH